MAERIDKKTVRKVAEIARLGLAEKELGRVSRELEKILEAFRDLGSVDTKAVKPAFQPLDVKNVMREDQVEESLTQEEALSNAKQKEDGYFRGPKAV